MPQVDPDVVLLTAALDSFNSAQNASSITPAFVRDAGDGEHWIAADELGRHQFLLMGDTSAASPLAAVIPLDANFATRADAALRLWHVLARSPGRRGPDQLTAQRRERLILALRALDGHIAGESYRVIAQVLFGARRVPIGAGWKTHDLRDRTIRLVRMGTKLMQGGYLDLLRERRRR